VQLLEETLWNVYVYKNKIKQARKYLHIVTHLYIRSVCVPIIHIYFEEKLETVLFRAEKRTEMWQAKSHISQSLFKFI
jgi:hypothetical protein